MENGKDYVPPALRKRADNAPLYRFWCQKCDDEADGYVIADIDHPEHCMSLNVYCHGEGVHIGIQDVAGFREMMAPHEITREQPDPPPYKLFHPNDFKLKSPYPRTDGTEI